MSRNQEIAALSFCEYRKLAWIAVKRVAVNRWPHVDRLATIKRIRKTYDNACKYARYNKKSL